MGAHERKARERRLLEQANRQFGLLRHEHLVAEAMTRNEIARRLAHSRLTRVHAEVYAFGHTALCIEGRWLAALWACGPAQAVLSHMTAAQFHRMAVPTPGADVHISTLSRARSRAGIAVHKVRRLEERDIFRPHPLAVTTIPRTLVDLADVLPWDEYRALADRLPSLRIDRLRQAQERLPGRRGAPHVRRLIEADDAHTKSEFERRFLRFLTAHQLPRPDGLNVRVAGHKADCVFRGPRLVVELDGRAFHQRRAQMRADRLRDSDYQLSGHRILRLVWDDLHHDQARQTADRVRRMLALR